MFNLFKRTDGAEAQAYSFTDFSVLREPEETVLQAETALPPEPEDVPVPPQSNEPDYTQIHAKELLRQAKEEAEQLQEQARLQAQVECEKLYREAKEKGYADGYAIGKQEADELMARLRLENEAQQAQMAQEVGQCLQRLSEQMDSYLDQTSVQLRDLAISIAEKIICISLRSSTAVIGKMVQTALDKRKQREWVHIYIAECDAMRMGQASKQLLSVLPGISERVRIIPMADDEPGTCIIETPEEIIDASAETQLNNLRATLDQRPTRE